MVDMFNCIQKKQKKIYEDEPFHAIVKPEQFSCIFCDYTSYYRLELYKHYKQTHGSETENNDKMRFCQDIQAYQCDNCRYESDSSLSLLKHHHDFCEKKLQNATSKHYAKAVESPHLNSKVDAHIFEDVEAKRSNSSTYASGENIDDRLKCNHCSYRAVHTSILNRHMLKHVRNEEIKWFKCNLCSFRTKRKDFLKRHMRLQHVPDKEINWFKCNLCPFRTKRKDYLKTHIRLQHVPDKEINWFKCNLCSYRAKLKRYLKKHTLRHTKDEEINWFKCNLCSYRAKLKTNLKKHKLKHTKDEDINWFKCNTCRYRTNRDDHLKRHIRSQHVGDDEIKLNLMQRMFISM